jgi:hypothetical protein
MSDMNAYIMNFKNTILCIFVDCESITTSNLCILSKMDGITSNYSNYRGW